MNFVYQCSECSKQYVLTPDLMVCPACAAKQMPDEPLRGVLDVVMQGQVAHAELLALSAWLPINQEFLPNVPVGNTPLWEPERLRQKHHFSQLFIKDESKNPTGSLKDRASFLVAAMARQHKITVIALASTGNAASSMAGIGAACGIEVRLFLPKNAPEAKIVQALQYGAKVFVVDGNYDKAYELSLAYCKKHNVLCRNTAFNPLTIEGKKTVSLELFWQLGRVPDVIFVPTGDGVILSGVYKGFRDLFAQGFIHQMPLIYAVQAVQSSNLYQAFLHGKFTLQPSNTIADSISVDVPRNGWHALNNLRKFGGQCIAVTDEEILAAQKELASLCGVFTEPAGAAAFAGFLQVRDRLPKDASVVLLATGHGLKDPQSAMKLVHKPDKFIATIDDIAADMI